MRLLDSTTIVGGEWCGTAAPSAGNAAAAAPTLGAGGMTFSGARALSSTLGS